MAGRIRSIKPEMLEDERTASLSDRAFRLFVGSILLADDYGNLRFSPRQLHAAVWWSRDDSTAEDVAGAARELEASGLVDAYQVRGQLYAAVRNWRKHQRVDNAGKARVPGPEEDDGGVDPEPRETLREPPRTSANLREPPREEEVTSARFREPRLDHRPPITDPDHQKEPRAGARSPGPPGLTSQDGQESAEGAGGEPEGIPKPPRALAADLAALRDALVSGAPSRVELSDEPTKAQAIRIRSFKLAPDDGAVIGRWLAAGGNHFPMKGAAVLSWKLLAQAGDDLRAQATAWQRNGSPALSRAPPPGQRLAGGLTVDDKTGIKRDAAGVRRGMIPLPEGY